MDVITYGRVFHCTVIDKDSNINTTCGVLEINQYTWALGNGALHIEYHDNPEADSCISLIESVVKKYGKVGIVADNAKAIVGKDVTHYINGTDGAVEMIHFLSHTPQLNPIEIEWGEIRRAVADIFFGGLDELQESITRMLANEEIAIVKLYDWLIPP